jgi:hypothetical protein
MDNYRVKDTSFIQFEVNEAYRQCELLKDKISLLNHLYHSTLTQLNALVFETGIHPNEGINQ